LTKNCGKSTRSRVKRVNWISDKIFNYDEEYYTKIFAEPVGYPDSPTTLALGGQWVIDAVTETSWGAIKAQY
jgi:hypothetical protein